MTTIDIMFALLGPVVVVVLVYAVFGGRNRHRTIEVTTRSGLPNYSAEITATYNRPDGVVFKHIRLVNSDDMFRGTTYQYFRDAVVMDVVNQNLEYQKMIDK